MSENQSYIKPLTKEQVDNKIKSLYRRSVNKGLPVVFYDSYNTRTRSGKLIPYRKPKEEAKNG